MYRASYRLHVLMIVIASSSRFAQAAPLLPGHTAPLFGTTAAANANLAGMVEQDRIRPFTIRNGLGQVILQGEVQERVVRSSSSERLIYAPRLRNLVNPQGDAWVVSMAYAGFEGVPVRAEYRVDGLGNVGPNAVHRSSSGDVMRFRYDPNIILPPDSGYFLSIETDAYESTRTGRISIAAQNDFGADVFHTTIPHVPVPAFAGDANLDGLFNTTDLVNVFANGEYEDGIADNSDWSEGDFNRDGEFSSYDLVLALRTGRYQQPMKATAIPSHVSSVPEPTSGLGFLLASLGLVLSRRRSSINSDSPIRNISNV